MAEGRGVRGRVNWKIRSDRYAPPCVKQIASGSLLYVHHGRAAPCSVMTSRGGTGWGLGSRPGTEGTCVFTELIHLVVWQQLTRQCKATALQLKQEEITVSLY